MHAISVADKEVMKPDVEESIRRDSAPIKTIPDMDDVQYSQWVTLLEERTGMRLPDNRMSFLVTNVKIRMRKLGFDNYQDYYDHLHSGHGGTIEWDALVHYLTVHETRFLRHQPTLDLICKHFLPQRADQCPSSPLTINAWSVGCSTGEEPYSMAMAIDSQLSKLGCEFYLGVIASDISRGAIAKGRSGIYQYNQIKQIQPEWLEKYFVKQADGSYQVVDSLRQRVCFNQLNVVDVGNAPIGAMDIIVCQNLLIYYDRARREKIVNQFVKHLTPGGFLILGVGELLHWSHPSLERFPFTNTLAYRHKK